MAYGLKRADLQRMAAVKLQDAIFLLEKDRSSNAYYLAGYAIEFALKACICRQIAHETLPDKNYITDSYTHDLSRLVGIAGLEQDRKQRADNDQEFSVNWAIVKDWNEGARYQVKQKVDAQYLIQAICNTDHGVLPWIQMHW